MLSLKPTAEHELHQGSDSTPLTDQFGRVKRKLRISLTDRCNFRCKYCMPEHPEWKPKEEILTFEEITYLARLFIEQLGINRIRLTGGEPLLRQRVAQLVAMLAPLESLGLKKLSMTTNGVRLVPLAASLKEAGLNDVNVSIDALEPEQFRAITGGGDVRQVLAGIEKAREVGLGVKLNAVVIRDMNEDQIVPLTRWAYEEGIPLRFIEFMPLDGQGVWQQERVVTEAEIIKRLSEVFEITPMNNDPSDPARYYWLNGKVSLGIIPTVSNPFCEACDRIRITADGMLMTCLFSVRGYDLKSLIRRGADEETLIATIRDAVYKKWAGFVALRRRTHIKHLPMHVMGG